MASPPARGSQAGDVYSFGIILQEIALRRGVFHVDGLDLSPKGERTMLSPSPATVAATPSPRVRDPWKHHHTCPLARGSATPAWSWTSPPSLPGPWRAPPLSPSSPNTEIVERVTRGAQPPFRPSLALQSHLEELGQLMQRCWAEEPQERPPFQQIRLMLRKFNRWLMYLPAHHPPTATLCPTLKSSPGSGRESPLQPTTASQPAFVSAA